MEAERKEMQPSQKVTAGPILVSVEEGMPWSEERNRSDAGNGCWVADERVKRSSTWSHEWRCCAGGCYTQVQHGVLFVSTLHSGAVPLHVV